MKPYVSKVVQFTEKNGVVYAGIITFVRANDNVDLTVFRMRMETYHSEVPFSVAHKPMHWSPILGEEKK